MIYSEEEVEDDCSTRAWKIESEIDSSFDRSGEIGERKPHRTITNWYLVKKTRRPNNVENYTPIYNDNIIIDPEKKILNEIRHDSERFIFSEDMKIDPALVLCGEVIMKRHQLQQQQKKKEPSIHVVIEKLKQACFDNHPNERGFWIESGKAWYKLDQPDTYYPQQQQQKVQFFLSQEDLFLPYRAMSALLSNLLDTMSNHTGYLSMYNVTFLRALTPEEIYERIYQYNYRRLLQKQQQLQYENYHNVYFPNPSTYISILSKESCEPFDIYLLKRKSNFVMRQLTRLRGLMTPSSRRSTISSTITTQSSSSSSHNTMCRFMDWLSKTASKAHKTNEIIGAEYLEKVAIAGEHRSSRDKYGYPIYTSTEASHVEDDDNHPSEMKWVNQCDLIFRKACIEHHSDNESEEESSNNNDDDENDEAAIEGQQGDEEKKSIPHFNRINIMVGEKIHGFISCYLNSDEIDFYIYPNRSETQTFFRRTTTPSITPQVSINHEDDDDHQSNSRSISSSSSDNEKEKPTVVSTLQKSDTRSEITTTNTNNNKRKKSLISDILMQRPRSQKIQRKK